MWSNLNVKLPTPAVAERTSTIDRERRSNPFLSVADADAFRDFIASRLGRFPAYYPHVAGLNRVGATLRERVAVPAPRSADEVERLRSDGAIVVWGDEAAVIGRVNEHLSAGADHVCVQVLTTDLNEYPLAEWRRIAAALR